MSTLDRAFLKAFSNVGASATAPVIPVPEAAKFALPPKAECAPDMLTKSEPAPISPPAPQVNVAPEPFVAPPSAAPIDAPAIQREPCIPAFQVDRFRWPEAVERLTSAAGDEFRRVAREMATTCQSNGTWMFASASRGDGCTTVMLTLARAFAAQNLKVVVLDADVTGGTLASQLGVRPVEGWEQAVCDGRAISEALVESIEDRFTIAPLGGHAEDADVLATEPHVSKALALLAENYDIVLIDAGPIAAGTSSAEAMIPMLPENSMGALVVRDARRTTAMQVEAAGARLVAAGMTHWNVAENFIQLAPRRAPLSTRSGDVRSVLATA